jgi:hypothetical protein
MNEPSGNRASSVISLIIICAAIILIAYLFVPHAEPPRRLWTPVLIETNGNETVLPESRQLEFWTPSARTKDYLHAENSLVVPTETWEVISNDDANEQFGMALHTNLNVLGYRRVEVWGQGRTTFKPGWWWTVNVLTNYSAGELAISYESFWKSHQPLFVEVIDNRGGQGSQAGQP